MFIAQFFHGHLKEKKIRPITIISFGARQGEKMCEKGKKRKKKLFFVLNKYQSVTHVFTCIIQGLFKNIVFRSVALVTKS